MSQQEVSRREAGVKDDRKLLSPPIVVEPLYQCATAVQVVGGVAGAKIEVEVNGAIAGNGVVGAVLPYGITIAVPPLKANDKVRARQTTPSAQSDWSSPAVTVGDHTKDYPAGPSRDLSPAAVQVRRAHRRGKPARRRQCLGDRGRRGGGPG
jgi:hypothetical protein